MITIRRKLLLLCILLSLGALTETRPVTVASGHASNTRLGRQTPSAVLPEGRGAGPESSPRRFQNIPAQGHHASGRGLKFTHLTTKDGLAQDNVVATLQDHLGFMWFATGGGLNRYDGNTFVVYQNNPDDPNTLSANNIQALLEDDRGYLWIGTWGGGLDKFDPTTERFTHYRSNPDNPNSISGDRVKSLVRDSRGYLWVGTIDAGLNRFDPATETFTRYRNDSNGQFVGAINSILEDSHRDIWFAGAGGLFHVRPETGRIIRPPASMDGLAADYLHEDRTGNLWMLTNSPVVALVKYDRDAERLTEYPFEEGAAGVPQSSILDDGQNGLWVASSQGLYRFDLQTGQFSYRFQYDETNPESLTDNKVTSLHQDRAGLLWIGTETGGLNVLDFRQQQFASYRHRPGDPSSLSPGVVTAMHQDRNGVLWVGLLPRALDRFDRKTGQITHYVPGSGNSDALGKGSNLNRIYRDAQGYLWLSSWGALDRFDERSGQFKHYQHKADDPNSLLSHEILCIYVDRSGRLWVGQVGGLSRFVPETETFINYRNEPADGSGDSGGVSAIYQDRSGTLWVGTWVGTLSRFDDKANTFVSHRADSRHPHRLSSGGIHVIHEDRAGTLWLGTMDGLYRYDRESGTFTHYTVNQGLPSGVIQCILDDRSGRLWLSTKNGLSRLDPQSAKFRNYDMSDGLPGNDFAAGACYEDGQSEEMLFAGVNGITSFYPDNVRDNPYAPPVVLTNFTIFNKPVLIGPKSVLKKAIPYADSLTLSHDDNVISFEFAALSHADFEKNRYRFRLENFDRGWNEVGSKQRLATYTNLDPGHYVFRVQGSNSDGGWNEAGVSLPILITPPWWMTTWFRTLFVGLVLALLWTAYQFRIRQVQREFAVTLEARVGERTRIARELHDTLLQSFHGLLLRLQTASCLLTQHPSEAERTLDSVIEQAAKAITEGRDAVQGLRGSTVEQADLAAAIRTLGDELARNAERPPALRVAVEGQTRELHLIVRDEIYRIVAEALRNTYRHAHAGGVEVEIRYDEDQFRLRVRDDGTGMDPAVIASHGIEGHYGLRGMVERAALIGGTVAVWSDIGAGTEVELRLPAHTVYAASARRSWLSRRFASKRAAQSGRVDS